LPNGFGSHLCNQTVFINNYLCDLLQVLEGFGALDTSAHGSDVPNHSRLYAVGNHLLELFTSKKIDRKNRDVTSFIFFLGQMVSVVSPLDCVVILY
jgi:hypothetical protein